MQLPPELRSRARQEISVLVVLAATTTSVFWWTDLDSAFTSLFFEPGGTDGDWPWRDRAVVDALYDHAWGAALSAVTLALTFASLGWVHGGARRWRRHAVYVAMVVVLGPGVLVNGLFKEYTGRPRPVETQRFGGTYTYVPPLRLTNSPVRSFVCGHCSVGFSIVAAYFLAHHYKLIWLALAVVAGTGMGLARVAVGAHFPSDVMWSGYVVFLVAFALYYGWFARGAHRP